jgi:hypothetical protein
MGDGVRPLYKPPQERGADDSYLEALMPPGRSLFFSKGLYGETSSTYALTNLADAIGARLGRHVGDGRVVWRMLDGQSFRCTFCHRRNASVPTWRRRSSSKWRRGIRRYAVGTCRGRTLRGRRECAGSHHER